MKFSEQGLEKIENYSSVDLKIEGFEPEDFKDVIVLTIEEAEILTQCAANEFYRLIMERGSVDLARQVEVLMYDLAKRIGQAKTSKICDDYNKALNKVVENFQKQEEIINLKCEIEQLKTEQEVDNYLKNQFLKSVGNKE